MLRLLQAEWIKLRHDKALFWALLGLLGAPLLVTAMFILGKGQMLDRNIWTAVVFAEQSLQMEALMLGPMILAVLGAQLITVEHRSQTLKGLLPLPTSLPGIVGAKALWGALLLGLAMQITGILGVLIPLVLGTPTGPDASFGALLAQALQGQALLWIVFVSYLLFAMLVSVVSKNFVVPLALSGVVQVAGLLALQGGKGEKVWTALPLMLVNYLQDGKAVLPLLISAGVYTAAFLAMALVWTWRTPRPE